MGGVFINVFIFPILLIYGISFSEEVVNRHSDPNLKLHLQPNDVTDGEYDGLTTAQAENKNICTRPCDGAKSMICYYTFVLENYVTVGPACGSCNTNNTVDRNACYNEQCVTADGKERHMLSINRQYPGPSIQVCSGDLIVIDLVNKMLDRVVTIHWHGLYQRYTPWMDGVPMVTQCPILPATTFRYKFPATPFGTFFFHSHQGLQKMDGIVGSLIVRRPRREDPLSKLFDFDLPSHVLLVTDWTHTMMDDRFPGNRFENAGALPDSYLANGRTQYFNPNGTGTNVPYTTFNVTKGKRYRFRLIGGTCATCPVLVTFEKHTLLFISSDGTPVQPITVDSVTLLPGERFDFVLTANQSASSYWIQLKGLDLCAKTTGYAILQYNSAPQKYLAAKPPNLNSFTRGRSLNPVDVSNCTASSDLCFGNLNALIPPSYSDLLKPKPDARIVLATDFYGYNLNQLFENEIFHRWIQPFPQTVATSLINNYSYVSTPFSMLTQNDRIPTELICPRSNQCGKGLPQNICECTHVIKIKLNAVAELLLLDWTPANTLLVHPHHLHGTDMHIIKEGKIPANIDKTVWLKQFTAQLDKESSTLKSRKARPIVKDTVGNLPSGYTVTRVHFNNPGMWYFHCHFIMHTDSGMTLVFQVGERNSFVRPPKGFPQCNNFKPSVSQEDLDWVNKLKT